MMFLLLPAAILAWAATSGVRAPDPTTRPGRKPDETVTVTKRQIRKVVRKAVRKDRRRKKSRGSSLQELVAAFGLTLSALSPSARRAIDGPEPKRRKRRERKPKRQRRTEERRLPKTSDAAMAAAGLYTYLTVTETRPRRWGNRRRANRRIMAFQERMGRLTADGIYGTKTRARGYVLTGRKFPARVSSRRTQTTPPPSIQDSAPQAAAEQAAAELSSAADDAVAAAELYRYVTVTETRPRRWGNRRRPNEEIKLLQQRMGGLSADGIYGPKTRARGLELTGKKFPPRK